MVRIFKRRKDRLDIRYRIWQKLYMTVERRQRQLAGYLNRKTASYSKRKWVLLLAFFCVVFGGSSGFIFWESMAVSASGSVQMDNISVPAFTDPHKMADSLLEFEAWKRYYKDSINKQLQYGKQDN